MKLAKKFVLIGLCSSLGLGSASFASAWPQRPIQIVVPQSAGGGADILARELAVKLQPLLGQPVVVENKPGAAGIIGTEYVSRAAPDGYTYVMGAISTHGINPGLYKRLSYDALKDFTPVSLVATAPLMVVTHPSFPAQSVQELIDMAKAKPGGITYASAGTGNSTHLAGELFKSMAGVDIMHVPFKGSTQAEVGLMGNHVSLMFSSILSAYPHSKEGNMKALAVTSAQRSAVAPELPTVAEAGLPGYDVTPWYGVFAPAGTPSEVIERMNKEIAVVLNDPDIKAKFASLGAEPGNMTNAEYKQFVQDEVKKWAKVVQDAGATIDQ